MLVAQQLNADVQAGRLNLEALQQRLQAQGEGWQHMLRERCPHVFAEVAVFISAAQLQQMQAVIDAIERVVALPGWGAGRDQAIVSVPTSVKGVFFGYDFHLNAQGAHLIEINTNAGGGFLNALLLDSQRELSLPGATSAKPNLELAFVEMFRNEWCLERGDAPLKFVAIIDEQPESQFLYPEFLLAQQVFSDAGMVVHIVAPEALQVRADGLYYGADKIDLVYNRLTDFVLQQYPELLYAYKRGLCVLTPHPRRYVQYADKRNLAHLTDQQGLRALGANDADMATLLAGVPKTLLVHPDLATKLWKERKQWFFKLINGYGGKGAYRGDKLTKRVFADILQGDYVAQQLATPGARRVAADDGSETLFKFDVRCYVYEGKIQLVAARLYQGQTTNLRTPGGGFTLVRVVG